MQTASLDILEKTQLPLNQARAILRVMELEITAHQETLATKGDLNDAVQLTRNDLREAVQSTKDELKASFQATKDELRASVQSTKEELRASVQATRDDLNAAVQSTRDDLNAAVQSTRDDLNAAVQAIRNDLRDAVHGLDLKIETVRGEIKGSEGKTARWVLTCTMGQATMIAGAVYFALTHFRG